jgi:transposase-like protein
MNIHKNARTTPRSRGQIVQRVLTRQETPTAVATAVGVSDRTVRKWVARYAAEAGAGLADRSIHLSDQAIRRTAAFRRWTGDCV